MNTKRIAIAAALFGALVATTATADENKDAQSVIRSADNVLANFCTDKKLIPSAALSKAKCVAVFPDVKGGAIVVGGQHGHGVITCRTADAKWSNPAFVDMTSASIGAQLGAKKTDMVLLLQTEKARDALSKGTLTLGGDISATLGSKDVGMNVDTGGSDVVAYTSDSGAFAGASLSGTRISPDEDAQSAYYKQGTQFSQALRSPAGPDADIQEMLKALPAQQG